MSEFCSVVTRELGEPLIGTASVAHRMILISWPKGQWQPKALTAPELAPLVAWAKGYDATRGGKTVIRLFAGPADPAGVEVRIFPAGLILRAVPLVELPTQLDATFEDLDHGRTPAGAVPAHRTLVVCTHGKHDRCCAKYGQAVFNRLEALAPAEGFDVVASTHLGGHRFAGTLLDLAPGRPGRMYGRIEADDVPKLLEHLDYDKVWLEHYRGRIDLEPAAQIAEAEALAAGAENGVTVEPIRDHAMVARWTGGEVEVEVEQRVVRGLKACGGEPEAWMRPVLVRSARVD